MTTRITFTPEELACLMEANFMGRKIRLGRASFTVGNSGARHLKRCVKLLSEGKTLDVTARMVSLKVGRANAPVDTLQVLQAILGKLRE